MPGYNPYTYQPLMRGFFITGNLRPSLPDDLASYVMNNPDASRHVQSLFDFNVWLQRTFPQTYSMMNAKRPDLLNIPSVIDKGMLAPSWGLVPSGLPAASTQPPTNNPVKSLTGLRGLGEYDEYGNIVTPTASMAPDGVNIGPASPAPATDWGAQFLDLSSTFLKQTLPAYYQAQAQKDIIQLNIARAEKGLAPIDASSIAPGVNVGLSPGVTQMGYVAVGGLVLVGLIAAMNSAGKGKRVR